MNQLTYKSIAHESIAVSTVAKKFTVATYQLAANKNLQADRARICVITNDIYLQTDGTDADNTGIVIKAGTIYDVIGFDEIRRCSMVRVSADATVNVIYGMSVGG
jgi:hypothetical protein